MLARKSNVLIKQLFEVPSLGAKARLQAWLPLSDGLSTALCFSSGIQNNVYKLCRRFYPQNVHYG